MPCSPQVQKKQTAFSRFASVDSGDSGESGQSDSSSEEGSEDEYELVEPGIPTRTRTSPASL